MTKGSRETTMWCRLTIVQFAQAGCLSCISFTMAKFASVLALLISGASAFVSQNNAKPATALNAAVWDPMVGC